MSSSYSFCHVRYSNKDLDRNEYPTFNRNLLKKLLLKHERIELNVTEGIRFVAV
jgi:hypothetical protein